MAIIIGIMLEPLIPSILSSDVAQLLTEARIGVFRAVKSAPEIEDAVEIYASTDEPGSE